MTAIGQTKADVRSDAIRGKGHTAQIGSNDIGGDVADDADLGANVLKLAQTPTKPRGPNERRIVIVMKIGQMPPDQLKFGPQEAGRVRSRLHDRLLVGATEAVEIARIAEDQFYVSLPRERGAPGGITDLAKAIVEVVLGMIVKPCAIGGPTKWITASLGITDPSGNTRVENIFHRAEIDVSAARAADGMQVRIGAPSLHGSACDVSKLDADLQAAVEREEFLVYAQPQVVFQETGARVTGYELLVRWRHPRRGILPPAEFMARAEETGLVCDIDMWLLNQACLMLAAWQNDPERAQLRLSINISTRHFRDPQFAEKVASILAATGAPAPRLMMEVTETSLLDDIETARRTMQRLRRKGVRLSLDDFGTGFASMHMLHQLPFHEIKIDQSFIRGLPRDRRASQIVSNIIQLSKAIGLDVIAEGVETEAQAKWLQQHDCHAAQGYLFGRPVPVAG